MADNQTPELFGQTPSQTVGPFFHYGLPWKGCADLTGSSLLGARLDLIPPPHDLLYGPSGRATVAGEHIEILGQLFDGQGAPVPDALIEIWQANSAGRYNSPADGRDQLPLEASFPGFGRSATARDGSFSFRTLLPGRVPGPGAAPQAPHIAVGVLGRGLLKRLVTRMYFEGQPANETDPIMALVAPERRHTLVASKVGSAGVYRFDIHLQGERETVFFDC